MQRYVQQLIDELRSRTETRIAHLESEESAPPPPKLPGEADEYDDLYGDMADHFRDVESYLAGPVEGVTQSLAYYAEVDLSALPPPDKLSAEEAQALFDELNYLISTHGHTVELDLAEDCPPQLRYGYMLKTLAEPTVMMMGGHSGHDCANNPIGCEFGEYCGCFRYYTHAGFLKAGGDPSIPAARFPTREQLADTFPEFLEDEDEDEDDDNKVHFHLNPAHASIDLSHLQSLVDDWIKRVGVRYFNELTNTAVLAEEVGEVARLAARLYGEQSFKTPEAAASAKTDWADELSDVLFVLTCLANQTGVDLTEAFAKGMAKRSSRDKDRHRGNDKLG